jgi:cytochrome c-type biogenesis protein CcmE
VLAKHDETYMPKDVADALKKQGHWKDSYGGKAAGSPEPARAPQSTSRIGEAPRADRGAMQ